ncbi:type II toxin-antitoxin system RelE/ParE family toxin [Salinarimonas sp. NSM]|uniref:type II toxin-antitoxin system RelE/ParE family toxin n=1 Tax=Salinarimonas sp. NSM TaxID=3458003 RepID=UPI004035EB2A
MSWRVVFHPEFAEEIARMDRSVRIELVSQTRWLERFGPLAKRPHVDTLVGSRYGNMKELRFNAGGGVWRVAFAFDPERHAILLVGGDKSGQAQNRFYRWLVTTADRRFADHLDGRLAEGDR